MMEMKRSELMQEFKARLTSICDREVADMILYNLNVIGDRTLLYEEPVYEFIEGFHLPYNDPVFPRRISRNEEFSEILDDRSIRSLNVLLNDINERLCLLSVSRLDEDENHNSESMKIRSRLVEDLGPIDTFVTSSMLSNSYRMDIYRHFDYRYGVDVIVSSVEDMLNLMKRSHEELNVFVNSSNDMVINRDIMRIVYEMLSEGTDITFFVWTNGIADPETASFILLNPFRDESIDPEYRIYVIGILRSANFRDKRCSTPH